jgi:transposase
MPRHRGAYPEAFRKRMVALVKSGRTPEQLAKDFEPTAQAIRNWVTRG